MTAVEDHAARTLADLLTGFRVEIPGVLHALAVSSDGLVLAVSAGTPIYAAEQFAAITSGLDSLTWATAELFGLGGVVRHLVETDAGFVLVARINEHASLGVITSRNVDLGQVGYEIAIMAERAGALATQEVVDALTRGSLG